ncbi:MAG: hypothetical protein RI947_57 [Candidatus Parcubacteria bacterium]|jgi:hypothetical protein
MEKPLSKVMNNLKKLSTDADAHNHSSKVADGDMRFWVHDGPVLRDMHELYDALVSMSDDQYNYHVSDVNNDFANWVETVLEDKHCAHELRYAHTRKAAQQIVDHHLSHI